MEILIFEDNKEDQQELLLNIQNLFKLYSMEYKVTTTNDYNYVLENNKDFDLIFLDIEVNENSGISLGIEIRKTNKDVCIIFLTHYSKYLIDGYKAHANRYFLKPINQEEFNLEMKNVLENYTRNFDGFYDEKISDRKILYNQIYYIEFMQRKTHLHFITSEICSSPYPLNHWISILPDYFAQSYKSILINLNHVNTYSKDNVVMNNNEIIPLSRRFRNDFITAFLTVLKRKV